MTSLVLRDAHRRVVRALESTVRLGELCLDADCTPFSPAWTLSPNREGSEGATLRTPEGVVHGTLTPGAVLEVGRTSILLECQGTSAHANARTEKLLADARVPLALVTTDGKRHVLGMHTLSLGKSATCDVVIDDSAVSALHCHIAPAQGGWEIRDAGSTNGTHVQGVRTKSAALFEGASIGMGRTRMLVVRDARNDADTAIQRDEPGAPLVGSSAKMMYVRQQIARFAKSPYPVLVLGETGSGKELVARMLHDQSARARGPFVAVNAGAIAADLVESELFGHERGAFTGAEKRRRGVFEEAHGGTLFLDEIGELPLALQSRLLRVLETREIRRVGGEGAVPVDVRVVCATHRDLPKRAQEGSFRRDLLYRLDLLRVDLPALRERRDDLPALARHLLARIARETHRACVLEPAALARLMSHDWPGNVRELYGALCRASVEADHARIGPEHIVLPRGEREVRDVRDVRDVRERVTSALPPAPVDYVAVEIPGPPRPPRDLDAESLRALLGACEGNVSRAAAAAGLARSTFRERLRRSPAMTTGASQALASESG